MKAIVLILFCNRHVVDRHGIGAVKGKHGHPDASGQIGGSRIVVVVGNIDHRRAVIENLDAAAVTGHLESMPSGSDAGQADLGHGGTAVGCPAPHFAQYHHVLPARRIIGEDPGAVLGAGRRIYPAGEPAAEGLGGELDTGLDGVIIPERGRGIVGVAV